MHFLVDFLNFIVLIKLNNKGYVFLCLDLYLLIHYGTSLKHKKRSSVLFILLWVVHLVRQTHCKTKTKIIFISDTFVNDEDKNNTETDILTMIYKCFNLIENWGNEGKTWVMLVLDGFSMTWCAYRNTQLREPSVITGRGGPVVIRAQLYSKMWPSPYPPLKNVTLPLSNILKLDPPPRHFSSPATFCFAIYMHLVFTHGNQRVICM